MKRRVVPGTRIEALVDGRLAVEGVALTTPRGDDTPPIRLNPSYLRAGLVALGSDDVVRVRPLGNRDIADEDDIASAPPAVYLDAIEFSELWLDGRLAYMQP